MAIVYQIGDHFVDAHGNPAEAPHDTPHATEAPADAPQSTDAADAKPDSPKTAKRRIASDKD